MKQQRKQRGLSLWGVLFMSMIIGGVVALALISARNERNLFAEIWNNAIGKVKDSPANVVLEGAQKVAGQATPTATAASGGELRKCIIDGKTVISNTDCKDNNATSRAIAVHNTSGIESPKVPVASAASSAPTSDPMLDKAIEKQLK